MCTIYVKKKNILKKLFQCVDPVKKCASDEWHTSPAAQQLSRRGPLYVTIPKHKVTPEKALKTSSGSKHVLDDQDQEEDLGSASLRSSHVVMVGVPAEIAVAISLASFLIGASLTGMLCCIHHRRAMSKTVRLYKHFRARQTKIKLFQLFYLLDQIISIPYRMKIQSYSQIPLHGFGPPLLPS